MGKTKYSLKDVQKIAHKKGGKCLCSTYSGTQKMDFRCKEGHVWKATSGNIFQGRWCPFCANHFSHTIEHAKIVAEQNKGKCLSKLYKNSRQHLNWECAKGHKWSASFDNIKGNKGKMELGVRGVKKSAWC